VRRSAHRPRQFAAGRAKFGFEALGRDWHSCRGGTAWGTVLLAYSRRGRTTTMGLGRSVQPIPVVSPGAELGVGDRIDVGHAGSHAKGGVVTAPGPAVLARRLYSPGSHRRDDFGPGHP
jgi:hypothetical protein